ncbi:MAG: hypothetical protein AB7O67_16655 [Vicinamibacterales bacterium]
MDRPQILIGDMCQKHQRLLVDQIGVAPDGPWRVCVIAAQIALFQGTTAHPDTFDRLGGDIRRIGELGCLACYRPDTFGEVVQAFQQEPAPNIAAVKALGERLVAEAGRGMKLSDAQGRPSRAEER